MSSTWRFELPDNDDDIDVSSLGPVTVAEHTGPARVITEETLKEMRDENHKETLEAGYLTVIGFDLPGLPFPSKEELIEDLRPSIRQGARDYTKHMSCMYDYMFIIKFLRYLIKVSKKDKNLTEGHLTNVLSAMKHGSTPKECRKSLKDLRYCQKHGRLYPRCE